MEAEASPSTSGDALGTSVGKNRDAVPVMATKRQVWSFPGPRDPPHLGEHPSPLQQQLAWDRADVGEEEGQTPGSAIVQQAGRRGSWPLCTVNCLVRVPEANCAGPGRTRVGSVIQTRDSSAAWLSVYTAGH